MAKPATTLDKVLKVRVGVPIEGEVLGCILLEMEESDYYTRLANRVKEGKAFLANKKVKIGKYYRKMLTVNYANRCIPVTKTKLYAPESKRKCRSCGSNKCHRAKNIALLRETIKEQIETYRDENFKSGMTCPLSGDRINRGSLHIDHIVPFIQLVKDWLAHIENTPALLCSDKLWLKKNLSYGESWGRYHLENATLQCTSAKANMSKGAKLG